MSERQLRISAWAIRNPIPIAVLFIGAVLAGWISYGALPIKNYPNIEFPAVFVTVTRSGAAPAEMETQITRPIENALAGLSNVQAIASTITQGSSTTQIQFVLGENLQKATDDVRSKVDQVRNVLPRDIDPPVVQRLDFDNQPIITYAVSAPQMSESELSWFIDNNLSRTLQASPGVGQVQRIGGVDREINILIDPERLAAHGLTAAQVNDALTAANVDSPGGRAQIGGREQTVRVLGAAVSVDQIRNLSIPAGNGRFVRLSDVADVGDGTAEVRTFALLNGRPVVGFQITKTKLSSEVAVEDGVDATIRTIEKDNPGVVVHKIVSQVDQTRASYLGHPAHPDGGHGPGRPGGLALPARLARHGDHGGGHAGLPDPHLRLHESRRVQPQHRDPAGPDPGDRHPGGRRHRRDREHREAGFRGHAAL